MANPERGEVDLTSEGKTYTLVLSMNALCEMQKRTSKTYGELARSIGGMDLAALREFLWAVLKKYHAKDFPTVERAGDLIDALPGGVSEAMDALYQLMELNAKRGKSAADPQTAQT
jgi:hypothetical protein